MAAPPPLPAPPPPDPSGGIVEPVPVVAPHFCAPYVVQLSVKEKFSIREGDFTITDTNGAVVIKVQGAIISIHNRRLILDANGNPLLSLREKVISMHNTWEAYRGDSTKSSDLLFTVKKSSIIQPYKTEMLIYLASNASHEVCDFKMNGSFKERACSFYLGNTNTLIAQMHREHNVTSKVLHTDHYGLTVFPNVDYVFISALVVILQELHTDKKD
ncbi:unnamed protein product [Urochloa humidicola]